jgi:hypothetical protein
MHDHPEIIDHSRCKCVTKGANESTDSGTHTTTNFEADASAYRRAT